VAIKNIHAQRKEQKQRLAEQAESKQSSAEDLKNAYKLVFGSDAGKKVLSHLKFIAKYDEDCFDPCSHTNAMLTGRRSMIVHINKILGE